MKSCGLSWQARVLNQALPLLRWHLGWIKADSVILPIQRRVVDQLLSVLPVYPSNLRCTKVEISSRLKGEWVKEETDLQEPR